MAFALANYKCLQSVSDPVCSVWQLAVALHLMPQKASLWNVLGLFISHANGTHKHCRDNVVILWVVAPWSLVGCSLRGCFVLYWVIKLFYSSSCKCVCCCEGAGAFSQKLEEVSWLCSDPHGHLADHDQNQLEVAVLVCVCTVLYKSHRSSL